MKRKQQGNAFESLEEATLWIGAFRYYLGRRTYAVHDFCLYLASVWPRLGQQTKRVIKTELLRAIEEDRKVRAHTSPSAFHLHPLGPIQVREGWEIVAEAIAENEQQQPTKQHARKTKPSRD